MGYELEKLYEGQDLTVRRDPEVVLKEATVAAKALARVLDSKKDKVIINGVQYLEFEDWQTLGRFYGVTVKVTETKPVLSPTAKVETTVGYEARAVALRSDGMEISAAEAMCLNDEKNWKDRPLFMLRSMAQTRACAKALRNVLGWVTILAGYKATPAEEVLGLKGETLPEGPAKKTSITQVRKRPPKEDTKLEPFIAPDELFRRLGERIGRCETIQQLNWILESWGPELSLLSPEQKNAVIEQASRRKEDILRHAKTEVPPHDAVRDTSVGEVP